MITGEGRKERKEGGGTDKVDGKKGKGRKRRKSVVSVDIWRIIG